MQWFGRPGSWPTIAIVTAVLVALGALLFQSHGVQRPGAPVAVVAGLAFMSLVPGLASYWRCHDANHSWFFTPLMWAANVVKGAADNAIVYPETDGTVYYTVGSAGRPRYNFQPGELETYRGHEVADTFVPNSYVWTADGAKNDEAVSWSGVRYRNYAFIRVDVRPGFFVSEMDVVAVDEYGWEFDKLTCRRQVRA